MSVIVSEGQARNLTTQDTRDGLQPDPTERRYVTFINDLGAVHTLIVDTEHAAQDAGSLLKWFDHTRAAIGLSHGDPTSDHYRTPDQIREFADKALGINQPTDQAQADGDQTQGQGGGY